MAEETGVQVLAELHYQDPLAALAWLEAAFGFETRMIVTDAEDKLVFSETGVGGQTVAVVGETPPARLSPWAVGGANTQTIQITGDFDADAHCERARAAGATILAEPTSTGIGRFYLALDLEGHLWSFRQRLPATPGEGLPAGWRVRFPSREKAAG